MTDKIVVEKNNGLFWIAIVSLTIILYLSDATIYIGELDQRVNDSLLYELFTQCGPVQSVYIPRDKSSGLHPGYGFIEFKNEDDVEYAIKIMNLLKLYGRPIKVSKVAISFHLCLSVLLFSQQ